MSKTELRKEFEALVKKITVQKDLFIKRIKNVDLKKAAEDPSEYENFTPLIDEFQNDLTYLDKEIYDVIDQISDELIKLYEGVENEIVNSPDEEFDTVDDNGDLLSDVEINDNDNTVYFNMEVESDIEEGSEDVEESQ